MAVGFLGFILSSVGARADDAPRVGPYAALIATGPHRGQSHCYVCETGDRPAVIIFARNLNDPLGRLVCQLDQALGANPDLRAWVTFLNNNQTRFDSDVVSWALRHAIRSVPLGIFEDAGGPPSYRIAPDADATVLLCVNRRVVLRFTFLPGELTDDRAAGILKALPRILENKKAASRPANPGR
jgi:hypothetical protein